MRQRVFPEVFVEVLDHSSQPRRKKESNRSQYTHQYKHPEEYPVNDHGHILPIFLYLAGEETEQRGTFWISHRTTSLFTSCQFSPLIDFSRMADFPIMRQLSPKCQSILACLSYEKFKVKLPRSHCSKDRPFLAGDRRRIVFLTVTCVHEWNNFSHWL